MKCTPHNLEGGVTFFLFFKKRFKFEQIRKNEIHIHFFEKKKSAKKKGEEEKRRKEAAEGRDDKKTSRKRKRRYCLPDISEALSLSLARSSLPLEKKKKYWQRSNLGAVQSMVDYKSSPQVLEHLEKSLAWTVFDTKWIPGTSSFVAVGAYARGRVGSK